MEDNIKEEPTSERLCHAAYYPAVICEGKYLGVSSYRDKEGFSYRKGGFRKDSVTRRMLCVHQSRKLGGCPGTANMVNVDGVEMIKPVTPHRCGLVGQKQEEWALKHKIFQQCERRQENVMDVFHSVCEGSPFAAALSSRSLETSMRRYRHRRYPPVPASLSDLGEILTNHSLMTLNDGSRFFAGIVGTGNDTSVVFVTEPLIPLLVRASIVHIDGTFKTRPHAPASRQLLTIMASENGRGYPVVYALMGSQTKEAYKAVFSRVQEMVPALNPLTIMSNYESGLHAAVRTCFPDTKHVGCWFHFCFEIYRFVCSIGLSTAFRDNSEVNEIIKQIMALPLLPAGDICEGMLALKGAGANTPHRDKFATLFEYMEGYWIQQVGPMSISVCRQPRRTNSLQESLHANFLKTFKKHPAFWNFMEKLVQSANKFTTEELKAANGLVMTRGGKRINQWMVQDARIASLTGQWILGRAGQAAPMTITVFLSRAAHFFDIGRMLNAMEDWRDETGEALGRIEDLASLDCDELDPTGIPSLDEPLLMMDYVAADVVVDQDPSASPPREHSREK